MLLFQGSSGSQQNLYNPVNTLAELYVTVMILTFIADEENLVLFKSKIGLFFYK